MAKTKKRAARVGRINGMLPSEWLMETLAGERSGVGLRVNENTALTTSAVFACVRNIADDVAKVPLVVYRETRDGGSEVAKNHPVYPLLRYQPNADMTSVNFRRAMMVGAALWGNGYAEITRTFGGDVAGLHPIHPSRVVPKRENGVLYYEVLELNGTPTRISQANMLHIQGVGDGGVVGFAIAKLGREAIGLAMAAERFAATFFGNGARVSGVLEHPGKLGTEAAKTLRESWNAMHQGPDNAHKVAILEEAMKFHETSTPPNEAQMIETRIFSIAEACRLFRMPPHKVFEMTRATFGNIEHQSIEYVQDTLYTWFVTWDQEIRRKLFRPSETDYYTAHQYQNLTRGDLLSRYNAHNIAIMGGWMSRDEARAMEGMNPIPDGLGAVYMLPLNMAPAERVIEGEDDPQPSKPVENDGNSPDTSDTAAARVSKLIAYHEPLLEAAFARVLRVEADRVRRAANNARRVEMLARVTAETPDYVRREVGPFADAFCASVWAIFRADSPSDAAMKAVCDETKAIADRHTARSHDEMTDAAKFSLWTTDRPRLVARDEIDNLTEVIMQAVHAAGKKAQHGTAQLV